MQENQNELRYKNIQSEPEKTVSLFPVISAYGPKKSFDMLLIYHYQTDNGPDYAVIGKFLPEHVPTSNDFSYLSWIYNLQQLLQGNGQKKDYRSFLKQLNIVKGFNEMNKILFTQEGYDLINGKFFFQKDGTIQRTVELEATRFDKDIIFGSNYRAINSENKTSHIDLFAPWQKYDEGYFLNRKDLESLIPGDSALLYAAINKDRLFRYMKKNHHKWTLLHNMEEHRTAPDEVAKYSLQLLDVVTDFQLEQDELRASNQKQTQSQNETIMKN